MSQTEATLSITLQCLLVGYSLTTAPLSSVDSVISMVIRLPMLVVVYMLQEVF